MIFFFPYHYLKQMKKEIIQNCVSIYFTIYVHLALSCVYILLQESLQDALTKTVILYIKHFSGVLSYLQHEPNY